jgi:type IV secretory pathway TraG/TraD family ATPase VirD4
MSEGGGSGISAAVVLQSLAQARARWGQHEAAAVWDAATVKIVLGGAGNADDLRDMAALLGTRPELRRDRSWSHGGRTTISTSTHDVPVLDVGKLRTLPFGRALLLLRSAPPIDLRLRAWTDRRDAQNIRDSRSQIEKTLRDANSRIAHV